MPATLLEKVLFVIVPVPKTLNTPPPTPATFRENALVSMFKVPELLMIAPPCWPELPENEEPITVRTPRELYIAPPPPPMLAVVVLCVNVSPLRFKGPQSSIAPPPNCAKVPVRVH